MEIRKLYLKDEFKNIKTDAYITIYSSSSNKFDENRSRKGILVIPGGGYNHLSVRENEPICLTFLKEDFVVASLTYTVNELDEFTPIDEGLASLAILRRYAKDFHLDVDNISVLGFSAGGHLASSLALFEAFTAAVYLDQGFEFTKKFVLDIIVKYIENEIEFLHDYKSKLQELVQTVKKSIIYEVIDEKGPAHNKTFTSIVKIDGIIMGKGTAGSKKASEQEAAKDALSKEAKVEK